MALTPTVADAAVIQTSWGNEIRNRTCQVFATATERNTWAAPNGAIAVTLDTNRLALRASGVWVPFSACLSNNYQAVTSAGGYLANIAHGLGALPRSVIVTPNYEVNGTVGVLQVTARTTTTFNVRVMKVVPPGTVNNETVGIYWMVAL